MKARVTVTLKSGVLDPQGQAIGGSLKSLGFAGVGSVRQGKVFDIEMGDTDPVTARETLTAMCERLLANTVIENFAIDVATTAWRPQAAQAEAVPEAEVVAEPEAVAEPELVEPKVVEPEAFAEPVDAEAEYEPAYTMVSETVIETVDDEPDDAEAAPAELAVLSGEMPLPPALEEAVEMVDDVPAMPPPSRPAPVLPASEPVGARAATSTTAPPWSSEPSSA